MRCQVGGSTNRRPGSTGRLAISGSAGLSCQAMYPQLPHRVPARLVLASIAGVWLCYFLLATLRGAVVGFDFSLPMLTRRLGVTFAAMALTAALLWPVLRALDARPLWLRAAAVLLAALPVAVGIAAVNQWAFSDIEGEVFARIGEKEGIKIRKDEAGNVLVDVPGEADLADASAGTVLLDARASSPMPASSASRPASPLRTRRDSSSGDTVSTIRMTGRMYCRPQPFSISLSTAS